MLETILPKALFATLVAAMLATPVAMYLGLLWPTGIRRLHCRCASTQGWQKGWLVRIDPVAAGPIGTGSSFGRRSDSSLKRSLAHRLLCAAD